MQQVINRTNHKGVQVLIVAASVFALLGVLSFIFHVTPKMLVHEITQFSEHHFFSLCIILLIAAVVMVKLAQRLSTPDTANVKRKMSVVKRMRALRKNSLYFLGHGPHDGVYTFVPRMHLLSLAFSQEEVLPEGIDQIRRQSDLEHAMKVGREYRQKVIVCFVANNKNYYTIGCIIGISERYVCFNGSFLIPIHSILKLEL